MKNEPLENIRARRTYVNVSLVFLVLGVSLQALIWLYWGRVLEPRLRAEATSQANVLAHSQAVKLADALIEGDADHRLQLLGETIDEILLFTGPENDEPLFLGINLEIDYEVVPAVSGSLDLSHGITGCRNCFMSEVGLYSPLSDELLGIARFRVSDTLFQRLSRDVHKTLVNQSYLGMLLLLLVWGLIMFLIREINRSRHQAETASRAKSSFLANMSHELRTPLNAIIGFSELIRRDPELSSKHHENLLIINRSGEYLLELINDVLELSKIEAARETLTESSFDLYDTLERVTEMIRLRAERKNLQLIFERSEDVPRYVKTDERKLRQILLNLLGNAVKFTEEGGVTLRVRQQTGSNQDTTSDCLVLHFEVEDSGPGITDEEREKMFEAFTQTQSGHDKKEGTGLGLAISRQFVRHLGGDISVRSSIGTGTVFAFTICAKPAVISEVDSPRSKRKVIGLKSGADGKPGHQCRILVVDDHPENRNLLRQLLEQVGFSVKTAENGKQAVELNTTWQPHLIWMDMRMPVMNGYEATKAIRRTMHDSTEKQPVIIALTASAFKEDRDAVLAAGCDDFVRRPFREVEIFDKIAEHLGVQYIHDADDGDRPDSGKVGSRLSTNNLKAGLLRLDSNRIAEFHAAIELSDMERMNQLVAEISFENKTLGDELKRLTDAFQYDHILTLLDELTQKAAKKKQGD